MGNFASYAAELSGNVPKLPNVLAVKHINRAWEAIRGKRLWSFLINESNIFFPSILPSSSAAGATVSVVYGSKTVVGNAAAVADWSTQIVGVPTPLIQRQFRVSSAGTVYNITAVSTTTIANDTLTLDMEYGGDTAAAQYSIYCCYKKAPDVNFKRWQSVVDPTNGFPLFCNLPRILIDTVDPQRGSLGQAYRVVNYKVDPDGSPIFEWWPAPTTQITYHAMWEKKAGDPLPTDSLPPQIPDSLLIDYALAYFSYPWANANVARYPELKGTNWLQLAIESKRQITGAPGVQGSLQSAMRNDEEIFQQTFTLLKRMRGLAYPISGAFEQQHSSWNIGR